MIKQTFFLFYSTIIISLTACHSLPDKQLKQALMLAGDNRSELEKVLAYYNDNPEKLAATRFLIINMAGHSGISQSNIEKLQPFYLKYVDISKQYNWQRSSEWQKEIDSLWRNEKTKIHPSLFNKKADIQTIKANWLINEIDRSFNAWKENVYTQSDTFDDFCKYILPYRFAEGICLDESRDTFYKRHARIFNDIIKISE